MRYLFQRVVHNSKRWAGPAPHRLRATGDGGHLEANGYAHDDWNFAGDIAEDGFAYGYTYFEPKRPNGTFGIMFATYDKGHGWTLAGYYSRARYNAAGARFPSRVIRQRAAQLRELQTLKSLGGELRVARVSELAKHVERDARAYRWQVRPEDMTALQLPVAVPNRLSARFGAYFTRPTELDQSEWDQLQALATSANRRRHDDYNDGGDAEFPEGRQYEAKHKRRERDRKLVALAKSTRKRTHGHLSCDVCDFSFSEKYGMAGEDFIEVHHNIPVSELSDDAKTRLSDVSLVCSNCHRMLHRRRPWLSVNELKKLVRTIARKESRSA